MEILKDFISQMPIIWRIFVFMVGLIFWIWFVFLYPLNEKNNLPPKNQISIGSVEGDYVGRDKNTFNLYKTEAPSVKKIEQFPQYKTLTIKNTQTGTLTFVKNKILLYSVRFRWVGDEALVLIKLPDEKEERAYKVTNDTQLPFVIQINTSCGIRLLTVEKKLADGLQIRTFSELSP